jgi:hypothetical protein
METMKEITMNELSEIVSDAGSDETITFTSMYEGERNFTYAEEYAVKKTQIFDIPVVVCACTTSNDIVCLPLFEDENEQETIWRAISDVLCMTMGSLHPWAVYA